MSQPKEGIYIIGSKDHPPLVVDNAEGIIQPDNPVIVWNKDGGKNQEWILKTTPDDGFTISPAADPDYFVRPESLTSGAKVVLSRTSQEYKPDNVSPLGWRIVVKDNNGLVLRFDHDTEGSQLQINNAGLGNDVWVLDEPVQDE